MNKFFIIGLILWILVLRIGSQYFEETRIFPDFGAWFAIVSMLGAFPIYKIWHVWSYKEKTENLNFKDDFLPSLIMIVFIVVLTILWLK